jgi:hypothetical protein
VPSLRVRTPPFPVDGEVEAAGETTRVATRTTPRTRLPNRSITISSRRALRLAERDSYKNRLVILTRLAYEHLELVHRFG